MDDEWMYRLEQRGNWKQRENKGYNTESQERNQK